MRIQHNHLVDPAPMSEPYIPQTKPYAHQQAGFDLSHRKQFFAYTMEQRTGKTKLTLDVAGAAYERGSITGLVVMGPKGVDKQWVDDEIPIHLPVRIPRKVLLYRTSQANKRSFKDALEELMQYSGGLSILACNVDACVSKNATAAIEKFLRKKSCMFVLDESSLIKTPKAGRTKAITRLAKFAKARRILDGTPNAENPLELFSQYRLLDPSILGFTSFTAFKARYAKYDQGYDPRSGKTFPKLVGYAHLDELQAKIAPFTYRVRREDVLDMPPKDYQKVYYELSDEQRRVYDGLRDDYRADLKTGETVSVTSVLTRYLRLQQVLSNKLPSAKIMLCPTCAGDGCASCGDEGIIQSAAEPTIIDLEKNPRIIALHGHITKQPPCPTIIWVRFRTEADDVLALGRELGRKVCRYDGATNDEDRNTAKRGFQAGVFDWFVGSAPAGGRGLTLSKCELMGYYSNYFALRLRLQSEDRGEAPGKPRGTGIFDIIAEDTVDANIVEALRTKRTLSDFIMGDPARVWI